MVSQKVEITNPTGLHLRPAGLFCSEALKHECKITFQIGNTTASAKSILSILGACVKEGDEIEIICEGQEEEEALEAMVRLVLSGLEE